MSTAEDLRRWNDCLHGGGLLSPASYAAMTKPRPQATRTHRWGRLGYGFGLQVSDEGGERELSHGGYVPGYVSTLIRYPEEGVDLVVLENVSWRAADMARAFWMHDRVRASVRARLRGR